MRTYLFILPLIFCCGRTIAQQQQALDMPGMRSAGLTISPQMLFLGVLDAGIYGAIEQKPFKDSGITLLAGVDVRNKLFQVRHQSVGLNTHGLKSHYDVNILIPAGVGYTFHSKKQAKTESFYLTAAPNFFFFKETVSNEYFHNTVKRSYYQTLYGITWSTTSISKKGRRVNTQLFVPVFARSFLEVARNMNVKIGVSF